MGAVTCESLQNGTYSAMRWLQSSATSNLMMTSSAIQTEKDQSAILDLALATAIAAGAEVLSIYSEDFCFETKADSSPLTEADIAAEALIVDQLKAAFPAIPIIAEEATAEGNIPECGSQFFLVDPLDGSKEFIARNGEFTVNIALIEDGVPVVGVVYAPAIGRIWWGGPSGAYVGLVQDNQIVSPVTIEVRDLPEEGTTLVGSRSHGTGRSDARISRVRGEKFKMVGSSLKFCLVAEGEADLYPRFGRTMEWDTAAGDAILRAAGGCVLDMMGKPLTYGKRNQAHDSDFANPEFCAIGNHAIVDLIDFSATS